MTSHAILIVLGLALGALAAAIRQLWDRVNDLAAELADHDHDDGADVVDIRRLGKPGSL